jgi:hypothetical protein
MYVTNNILSSVDATGGPYHSLKPIDTSTSITVGITRYIGELERDQAFIRGRSQAKLPPTLALPRTMGTRPIRTHTPAPGILPRAQDKSSPLVDFGIRCADLSVSFSDRAHAHARADRPSRQQSVLKAFALAPKTFHSAQRQNFK